MISRLSGRALSAAELGRKLGISQAAASYHLRKLAEAGFVDQGATFQRCGPHVALWSPLKSA